MEEVRGVGEEARVGEEKVAVEGEMEGERGEAEEHRKTHGVAAARS